MSHKPKMRDRRFIDITIWFVLVAAIMVTYHFAGQAYTARWGHSPTYVGDRPLAFDHIDSSYCIACHTSERVMSLSTYGQDKGPAENTGG